MADDDLIDPSGGDLTTADQVRDAMGAVGTAGEAGDVDRARSLMEAIVASPVAWPEAKGMALMATARAMMSRGMNTEAHGLLQQAADTDPGLAQEAYQYLAQLAGYDQPSTIGDEVQNLLDTAREAKNRQDFPAALDRANQVFERNDATEEQQVKAAVIIADAHFRLADDAQGKVWAEWAKAHATDDGDRFAAENMLDRQAGVDGAERAMSDGVSGNEPDAILAAAQTAYNGGDYLTTMSLTGDLNTSAGSTLSDAQKAKLYYLMGMSCFHIGQVDTARPWLAAVPSGTDEYDVASETVQRIDDLLRESAAVNLEPQ